MLLSQGGLVIKTSAVTASFLVNCKAFFLIISFLCGSISEAYTQTGLFLSSEKKSCPSMWSIKAPLPAQGSANLSILPSICGNKGVTPSIGVV